MNKNNKKSSELNLYLIRMLMAYGNEIPNLITDWQKQYWNRTTDQDWNENFAYENESCNDWFLIASRSKNFQFEFGKFPFLLLPNGIDSTELFDPCDGLNNIQGFIENIKRSIMNINNVDKNSRAFAMVLKWNYRWLRDGVGDHEMYLIDEDKYYLKIEDRKDFNKHKEEFNSWFNSASNSEDFLNQFNILFKRDY